LCLGLFSITAAVVHAGTRPSRARVVEVAPTGPLVTIDPRGGQTIQGFGASGAWWPYDVARFAPAAREHIGDLLFTGTGLDLSIFRYEIGSGGQGVTNPARAPQTFAVSPGVYDWTRDADGRVFLQQASDRGVPVLIGFVVSPPTFWTTNGKTCGGYLKPGSEAAFAGYITDVVTHLHDQGITLSYVSPMNEPDNPFTGCWQEGAAVPSAQRARVVAALAGPLAARAPYTHVIADESSLLQSQLIAHLDSWLTPSNASQVGAIATHLYDYPSDDTFSKAAAVAARVGRPIWTSEVCCYNGTGFGAGYDPTMTNGLWLADTMWQALGPGRHSAFMWWTALSSSIGCNVTSSSTCASTPNKAGWNDGLLYYDPNFRTDGNQAVSFTKRFWIFANFSRFIRPGATAHELSGVPRGVRALAFSNLHGWTVVAINDRNVTSPFNVQIPWSGRYTLRTYRTSATEDLVPVSAVWNRTHQTVVATLSPRSVTTFQLTAK
jgi:O-glycosyl hydrolase